MHYKQLIYFGIIIVCYLTIRVLLPQFIPKTEVQPPIIPYAYLTDCEDTDLALSLTKEGVTICQNDTSLYTRLQGKKFAFLEKSKERHFFINSLGYIVSEESNIITIDRFQQSATVNPIYSLHLTKGVSLVGTFTLQTEDGTTFIFLNTEKEAKTSSDIKSVLYRIEISTQRNSENNPTITSFESKEMLRVVDAYYNGDIVFCRELFPFLAPKFRILHWGVSPTILPNFLSLLSFQRNTTIPSAVYTTNSNLASQVVSFDKNGNRINSPENIIKQSSILQDSSGTLSFSEETSSLMWTSFSGSSSTPLLSYLPTFNGELVAKYSTKIGKRVYNCFDFGESLQITLRTCIPEL